MREKQIRLKEAEIQELKNKKMNIEVILLKKKKN